MKKKIAIITMAVLLVSVLALGGTLAWLTARTDPAVNTFVVGQIGELALNETAGTTINAGKSFLIVPGVDTAKNPKVAFTPADGSNNVAVYIFVKVDAANWSIDPNHLAYSISASGHPQLTWTVNSTDWTYLTSDGTSPVYYKALNAGVSLPAASVISGDKISVSGTYVTKDNIGTLASSAGLTFTAYAIQQAGFDTVAAAWDAAKAA